MWVHLCCVDLLGFWWLMPTVAEFPLFHTTRLILSNLSYSYNLPDVIQLCRNAPFTVAGKCCSVCKYKNACIWTSTLKNSHHLPVWTRRTCSGQCPIAFVNCCFFKGKNVLEGQFLNYFFFEYHLFLLFKHLFIHLSIDLIHFFNSIYSLIFKEKKG